MPKELEKKREKIYDSCMDQYNDKKKCEELSWAVAVSQEKEKKRNDKTEKPK